MSSARRGVPLHTQILLGLAVGASLGVGANLLWRDAPGLLWTVDHVASPIGQVFLRMLFMVVVPLVFATLSLGVANLGDLSRVGRIGAKTLLFFVLTTALAATVGLVLVNLLRPGDALDPAIRNALMTAYSTDAAAKVEASQTNGFGVMTFVNIVPRNPVDAAARGDMLGLIFFTLVFGIALTRIPPAKAEPVMRLLDGLAEAVMVIIGFAMRLAPIGVAALIFTVTARFGFEVLQSLGLYVVVVMAGLLFHQFGVIAVLARLLGGLNPLDFFRRARALMVTAFSTSSSNATLPSTIRTAERQFGVPAEVAGFVLPLGATMNMNGTALFEGITVLFPGTGLRRGTLAADAGDGGGDGGGDRHRGGGGAGGLDPAAGDGAGDGRRPRRRDRAGPGSGPHPRHGTHRPERDRRPPHLHRDHPQRAHPAGDPFRRGARGGRNLPLLHRRGVRQGWTVEECRSSASFPSGRGALPSDR